MRTGFRRSVLALLSVFAMAILYVLVFSRPSMEDHVLIRIGHDQPTTNERHKALEYFKQELESRSNGHFVVEIYPNGLLGNESVLTESVALGDLEMVAASATSQYGSLISVFELPYLFDSYEAAWKTLDGPIGQEIAKTYEKNNLHILSYLENGMRQVTSNREIHSPADLKGLKIRTPEFPMSIRIMSALGANPTPMGFSELYTALQQGTVDAQENPVANAYTNKFQEVQKYLIFTNHQYMAIHLIIRQDLFESLPKEDQELMTEVAREAAHYHRHILRENEQKMVEDLKQQGMQVIEVDMKPFRELTQPVYDWFATLHGEELVERIRQEAQKEETP